MAIHFAKYKCGHNAMTTRENLGGNGRNRVYHWEYGVNVTLCPACYSKKIKSEMVGLPLRIRRCIGKINSRYYWAVWHWCYPDKPTAYSVMADGFSQTLEEADDQSFDAGLEIVECNNFVFVDHRMQNGNRMESAFDSKEARYFYRMLHARPQEEKKPHSFEVLWRLLRSETPGLPDEFVAYRIKRTTRKTVFIERSPAWRGPSSPMEGTFALDREKLESFGCAHTGRKVAEMILQFYTEEGKRAYESEHPERF
jgi:hypothetical protein